MALRDTVVLQVDDTRRRHLNWAKNSNNLQNSVVETWSYETIVFFVATPEIRTAHKTIKTEKSYKKYI